MLYQWRTINKTTIKLFFVLCLGPKRLIESSDYLLTSEKVTTMHHYNSKLIILSSHSQETLDVLKKKLVATFRSMASPAWNLRSNAIYHSISKLSKESNVCLIHFIQTTKLYFPCTLTCYTLAVSLIQRACLLKSLSGISMSCGGSSSTRTLRV